MIERTGIITFKENDVTIVGMDIKVGQMAPEFSAMDQNWQLNHILEKTKGKVRIIASVPSLETSVCDRETRRFNQEATSLDDSISIIVISTDLPFTQAKWCGSAGIEGVWIISDHQLVDFGEKYGCLLKEPRILRRAVFIVDKNDEIAYVNYMKILGDEPDYDEIIAIAKNIIQPINT